MQSFYLPCHLTENVLTEGLYLLVHNVVWVDFFLQVNAAHETKPFWSRIGLIDHASDVVWDQGWDLMDTEAPKLFDRATFHHYVFITSQQVRLQIRIPLMKMYWCTFMCFYCYVFQLVRTLATFQFLLLSSFTSECKRIHISRWKGRISWQKSLAKGLTTPKLQKESADTNYGIAKS